MVVPQNVTYSIINDPEVPLLRRYIRACKMYECMFKLNAIHEYSYYVEEPRCPLIINECVSIMNII